MASATLPASVAMGDSAYYLRTVLLSTIMSLQSNVHIYIIVMPIKVRGEQQSDLAVRGQAT